jgi:hypothetical protein
MPKDKRKLYKCVKKILDDSEFLCVKFKNLKKSELRLVREEINLLLKDFFEEPEPEPEPEYEEKNNKYEKR